MKAIIQRAKKIMVGDLEILTGCVVFVKDTSQIDWILNKVWKIKMWNDWKSDSTEMNYKVCLVFPEKMEKIPSLKTDKIIFLNDQKLKYINDGPCTFLID